MNFKLLALTTISFLLFVFCLAYVFELPVAYVPKDATVAEFTLYNIIFMAIEVAVLSFLFMHMVNSLRIKEPEEEQFQ